jgi:hypothetical protein
VNIHSCVGYRVCFGTRGRVLYKSCNVEIVQDGGRVFDCWGEFNAGGKENRGVSGKKGYIYSSLCNMVHILRIVG